MSNSEVLEAAIKKAWTKGEAFVDVVGRVTINYGDGSQNGLWQSIGDLVFSHKFAKAFWGEDLICFACGEPQPCWCDTTDVCASAYEDEETCDKVPAYKHHLQVMVLKEDPIQYLKQFL